MEKHFKTHFHLARCHLELDSWRNVEIHRIRHIVKPDESLFFVTVMVLASEFDIRAEVIHVSDSAQVVLHLKDVFHIARVVVPVSQTDSKRHMSDESPCVVAVLTVKVKTNS